MSGRTNTDSSLNPFCPSLQQLFKQVYMKTLLNSTTWGSGMHKLIIPDSWMLAWGSIGYSNPLGSSKHPILSGPLGTSSDRLFLFTALCNKYTSWGISWTSNTHSLPQCLQRCGDWGIPARSFDMSKGEPPLWYLY